MAKQIASYTIKVDTKELERIINSTPQRRGEFLDREAEWMVNDIKRHFGISPAPPGGPPGIDKGKLINTIEWDPEGADTRIIHDGTEYGVYLELGSTRHGYTWPFMGPSMERLRRDIVQHAREFEMVR